MSISVQDLPSSSFASIPSHLNGTPMPREVRQFFYKEAAHAMTKALELGQQRMQIRQVQGLPHVENATDGDMLGPTALLSKRKLVHVAIMLHWGVQLALASSENNAAINAADC